MAVESSMAARIRINARNNRRNDRRRVVTGSVTRRVRPIPITATTVVGPLPLIYTAGPGSSSRYQIGVVPIRTPPALHVVQVARTLMSKRDRPLLATPRSDEKSRRPLLGGRDEPDADAEARA